jgi:hypothetical protein
MSCGFDATPFLVLIDRRQHVAVTDVLVRRFEYGVFMMGVVFIHLLTREELVSTEGLAHRRAQFACLVKNWGPVAENNSARRALLKLQNGNKCYRT